MYPMRRRPMPNPGDRFIGGGFLGPFVLGGLEPLDSFDDVWSFISFIRDNTLLEDDIIIYTGYYPEEIEDKINKLKKFKNIYLKSHPFCRITYIQFTIFRFSHQNTTSS